MVEQKIYIVLSQTVSVVGMTLRKMMRSKYAHVSISFHETLSPMYSFSRLDVENPFVGGASREELSDYFLGKESSDIGMKVYGVPVTPEEFRKVKAFVLSVVDDFDGFKYNFLEPVNVFKKKNPIKCYKTYVCSTFVVDALKIIKIGASMEEKSFIKPEDIGLCLEEYLSYQGKIKEYPYFNKETVVKFKRNKMKVVKVPVSTAWFYSSVLIRHVRFKLSS